MNYIPRCTVVFTVRTVPVCVEKDDYPVAQKKKKETNRFKTRTHRKSHSFAKALNMALEK